MKRMILLLIVAFCASNLAAQSALPIFWFQAAAAIPTGNTWTFRHFDNTSAAATNPVVVTVTSTVAHDLLVAGIEVEGGSTAVTITGVSGGCNTTWTHVPNSAIFSGSSRSTDLYSCTDALGSVTSISITATGTFGTGLRGMVWQATPSSGASGADTGATPSGTRNDTTNFCSTTCPSGVALTLDGTSDFIVGIAAASGSITVTGITAGNGCVKDFGDGAAGFGAAHCINSGSATYPLEWKNSVGAGIVMSAAAFK